MMWMVLIVVMVVVMVLMVRMMANIYETLAVYDLSHSVMCDSLWPHGLWPARLLCPWDSPGKNTGVGCHALQVIFPGIESISLQVIFPGIESISLISTALAGGFLPLAPPGKPSSFPLDVLLTPDGVYILMLLSQFVSLLLIQSDPLLGGGPPSFSFSRCGTF